LKQIEKRERRISGHEALAKHAVSDARRDRQAGEVLTARVLVGAERVGEHLLAFAPTRRDLDLSILVDADRLHGVRAPF
jgi:hypothetical protein